MVCPVSREEELIVYLSVQDSAILPALDYPLTHTGKYSYFSI